MWYVPGRLCKTRHSDSRPSETPLEHLSFDNLNTGHDFCLCFSDGVEMLSIRLSMITNLFQENGLNSGVIPHMSMKIVRHGHHGSHHRSLRIKHVVVIRGKFDYSLRGLLSGILNVGHV